VKWSYRQTSVFLYVSNPYGDTNRREMNIYGIIISLFF